VSPSAIHPDASTLRNRNHTLGHLRVPDSGSGPGNSPEPETGVDGRRSFPVSSMSAIASWV
jgi:hypothetical protein